jgi:hypothetical protein
MLDSSLNQFGARVACSTVATHGLLVFEHRADDCVGGQRLLVPGTRKESAVRMGGAPAE